MRILLWGVLAMSITGLVMGCVEWLRSRGRQLAMSSLPAILIASSMLLSDDHTALRWILLAAALAFSIYNIQSALRGMRTRKVPPASA